MSLQATTISKNEISALNDIFGAASTYNFDFNQAIKDGDAVRRDINISFTAGSYSTAESIIEKLHDCKYRCLIRNISINTSSGEGISSGSVSVSMTVTFLRRCTMQIPQMDWKRIKMRGQLHQKLNNENGFTLAETLVALAISIILLAITMVGILQYYKNMKLTEMDTTAKEIFIAAQNHFDAGRCVRRVKDGIGKMPLTLQRPL